MRSLSTTLTKRGLRIEIKSKPVTWNMEKRDCGSAGFVENRKMILYIEKPSVMVPG